jgi:hypothetical protein
MKTYTYKHQPSDNVLAWRMGEACRAAARDPGGDLIDPGLVLLRELEARGCGVTSLNPSPAEQFANSGLPVTPR